MDSSQGSHQASARAPKGRLARRVLAIAAIVVALLLAVGAWYVNDYYHADETALAAMDQAASEGIEVRELSSGGIAFIPSDPIAGVVFYPGAKVQPEAYAPLMRACAQRGMLCVLAKPLFNLAILDADAADAARAQFPEIDEWIVAGHSMGGIVAADYASRHQAELEGVALLASYPAADLSQFEGDAVSLVGSNDGVINRDALEAAQSKLPPATEKIEIAGGNHANFGNYGEQAGDGAASLPSEEQQNMAADAISGLALAA